MTPMQQLFLGTGSAVDPKTYVDDVFNIDVYVGDGYHQTLNTGGTTSRDIVNGIDFTEGGLAIFKQRNASSSWQWVDTENGATNALRSENDDALDTNRPNGLKTFNNNGFTIGYDGQYNFGGSTVGWNNAVAGEYVAHSFRKAKGFFDVVSWTGTGADRLINHGLGSVPGLIFIKRTNDSSQWLVYSSAFGSAKRGSLSNSGFGTTSVSDYWNDVDATATQFSLGDDSDVNGLNDSYIAYVFAGGKSTAATARCVEFDGSSGYLSVASSSDLTFGTGDFTVEFWAKPDDFGSRGTFYDSRPSGGDTGITIGHESSTGEIRVYMIATGGSDIVVQSSDFEIGQWQHIAVTRASGTVRLFINGILKDSGTRTSDLNNTNAVNIGYKTYTSSSYDYFDGRISNLRVVKGTAVYTSSFKPPTEPLTNITNTKLLCCNNSSTTGSTVTPGTITANNSPTASTDSPFDDPAGFVFGENEDQNVVKCGSYVGSGSAGLEINVGFEPQLVLLKRTDLPSAWKLHDSIRGVVTGGNDGILEPNDGGAESTSVDRIDFTSTGFLLPSDNQHYNNSGNSYIYMAVRRSDGYVGKPPELGTNVFTPILNATDNAAPFYRAANHVVDFALAKRYDTTESWWSSSRLIQGKYLQTDTTSAEQSNSYQQFDFSSGYNSYDSSAGNNIGYLWKRHAGFEFQAYTGVSGNGTRPHNMNTTPEMIWCKNRDQTDGWAVFHKDLHTYPQDKYLRLDTDSSVISSNQWYLPPTSTHWHTASGGLTNVDGEHYIAMLFASVDGISKVGSYTGNGTSGLGITVGFQPRFVVIKNTSDNYSWLTFDTTRGWGSGNDKLLKLNSDAAQYTSTDYGAPTSNGFTVGSSASINQNGDNFIYYAHA